MTAIAAPTAAGGLVQRRPARAAATSAFWALVLRDVQVLWKDKWMFLARTIMQPLLLLFVFCYVFPKIGQGIGGGAGAAGKNAAGLFSAVLVGGILGSAVIFQGIQAVALPMVQDFGFTREIEDRVMAPMPIWALAMQKIASGAVQAAVAAIVVFPLAYLVPLVTPQFSLHPLVLAGVLVLSSLLGAALGLTIGTRVAPYQVGLVFSLIVLPMTFLGCVYYPWKALASIKWLQYLVLVNPLVYMSEGFRASLVPESTIPHMPLWVIFPVMAGFTVVLSWLGIKGFTKRVLT